MELPNNTENNYTYIITYLLKNGTNTYLIIKEMQFSFDNSKGYEIIKEASFKSGERRMISCFFTVKLKYICFYQNENNILTALVFTDINLSSYKTNVIYTPNSSISSNEEIFMKTIHFIEEIGVFVFYTEEKTNFPSISLYE